MLSKKFLKKFSKKTKKMYKSNCFQRNIVFENKFPLKTCFRKQYFFENMMLLKNDNNNLLIYRYILSLYNLYIQYKNATRQRLLASRLRYRQSVTPVTGRAVKFLVTWRAVKYASAGLPKNFSARVHNTKNIEHKKKSEK